MSVTTIHETAGGLSTALIEYIEATYHIADPALLKQRRTLLEKRGIVHQAPYLESTPRYQFGNRFSEILGLPPAALEVLQLLATPRHDGKVTLYDPPYKHQSQAILKSVVEQRNLLIMTGTGSGKTESFLMPILGMLAREAKESPTSFSQSAMRAMILYPMNALVNDQLGRLRAIFGDTRLVSLFKNWGERPPRFARYTSRTPYAGLRDASKDQRNLREFRDFYVSALEDAESSDPARRAAALKLMSELKARGKWPAKPDLAAWYGADHTRWKNADDQFVRCITLDDDSELVTRHEAQVAAPDLMVTNYSMLEYMLMRPVERTIFDQTRAWLQANPSQRFMVVLDEAHLYRGAGGAEVGLLLRRLRDRLQIPVERFQVICATASFSEAIEAPVFASRLTGTPVESFDIIEGDLRLRESERPGTLVEAKLLASLDMSAFYTSDSTSRANAIAPFLRYCGVDEGNATPDQNLFRALDTFGPLSLLINMTMKRAQPVEDLGGMIFDGVSTRLADLALTNLAALATSARLSPDDPSLLPCRVHTFFRGLRGLWACTDENCSQIDDSLRGVVGKLYTQPIDLCDCGARVLELFTCRLCGTAYARGYCSDPAAPRTIWNEPGAELRMSGEVADKLQPLDMMLSASVLDAFSEVATYDLITGVINPATPSERIRSVYLARNNNASPAVDDDEADGDGENADEGVFHVCGACRRRGGLANTSPVQDHETKGDQPFQVLVSRQLQVQPPGPQPETTFAPLRGRKVLVFSDSRQVAARLAPNLQMFAARDSLRPLIAFGWRRLAQIPNYVLRLDDLYAAVLIAAQQLSVRLRPELAAHEQFSGYQEVADAIQLGGFSSNDSLKGICDDLRQGDNPPDSLLADIMTTLRDRSLGLEALALASIVERTDKRSIIINLPPVPGVTETNEDKLELARAWLRQWQHAGFWLRSMGQHWYRVHPNRKVRVTCLAGAFARFVKLLPTPAAKRVFKDGWIKPLLNAFCSPIERQFRLNGHSLSLMFDGPWVRCADCKSVHRPTRLLPVCLDCGRPNVIALDPENDDVFIKRKGYYRNAVLAAMRDDAVAPMAIIAAEHTAQLNSAQKEEVFSKAEINELLFQDVELPPDTHSINRTAIDVLSSTTTMEVGIDIGQLSGVALRNMPPSRSNYQQRAGRAGRRASAIASVVAFGGSDTHDEHFFSRPSDMITGKVVDPKLSLNNIDIARRHLRAFLLQCYLQARIVSAQNVEPNLFSVLGKVGPFLKSDQPLNRRDLETWLNENEDALRTRADGWLPVELATIDRQTLLNEMIADCLGAIDQAVGHDATAITSDHQDADTAGLEVQAEANDARPSAQPGTPNLLDTLLYKGVLPRYAFPTDVSTFHVFDIPGSTRFRPKFEFAPSQGAAIALTQYAPGKQVWIAGRCYESGAIYSPISKDRHEQWDNRRLQMECSQCGYTCLENQEGDIRHGDRRDCRACRGEMTLGPARPWFRPTGFAHPQDAQALLSPDEIPETSYATRAKLTMETSDNLNWTSIESRIRFCTAHTHLLVSNTGPKKRGYNYCLKCGRIEATTETSSVLGGNHAKPYPDPGKQACLGGSIAREVILGTDFITDVALFSLKVDSPIKLFPADSISHVALRTLCEALSRAATDLLEIEAGEVMAEFRPALTQAGCEGLEAEIFLYDTLPGGAGFAQEAALKRLELFTTARELMEKCPEECKLSCYRCLRSFRNRLDHGLLDRHTGIALIDYLISGSLPAFNVQRLAESSRLLFADLKRQTAMPVEVSELDTVSNDAGKHHIRPIHAATSNGSSFLISVVNPLCEPTSPREVQVNGTRLTLIEVNELMVRKNLGDTSLKVWSAMGLR